MASVYVRQPRIVSQFEPSPLVGDIVAVRRGKREKRFPESGEHELGVISGFSNNTGLPIIRFPTTGTSSIVRWQDLSERPMRDLTLSKSSKPISHQDIHSALAGYVPMYTPEEVQDKPVIIGNPLTLKSATLGIIKHLQPHGLGAILTVEHLTGPQNGITSIVDSERVLLGDYNLLFKLTIRA